MSNAIFAKNLENQTEPNLPFVGVKKEDWTKIIKVYDTYPWCYSSSSSSPLRILAKKKTFKKDASQKYLPRVIISGSMREAEVYVALRSLKLYPYVTVVSTHKLYSPFFQNCFPHVEFLDNPKPDHLAAAWNFGITKHLDSEYFLICNDDVLFPFDWLERLRKIIDEPKHEKAVFLSVSSSIQFSAFILPLVTWQDVGPFDDGYKAYFEDDDYWIRLEECYGKSKEVRPRDYLKWDKNSGLQPAVYHRRTGWGKYKSKMKVDSGTNMKVSKELHFTNWPVVTNETLCHIKEIKCLTSRKNVAQQRSLKNKRLFKGPGCTS